MKKLYSLLLGSSLSFAALAQHGNIILNEQSYTLNHNIEALQSGKTNGETIIIMTDKSVNASMLNQAGYLFISSLGQNTYIVQQHKKQLQPSGFTITAWHPYEAIHKIQPDLLQLSGSIDLNISVAKSTNIETLKSLVINNGGIWNMQQQWAQSNMYKVTLPADKLLQVAAHADIIQVGPHLTDETLMQDTRYYTNSGKSMLPIANGGRALKGRFIYVGVGDDSHPFHLDLNDRLINFNPQNNTAHGYHVATTVAGAGIKDPVYTGFSPKSTVIANYFSNIISESPVYSQDFNMTVTNNSYGAELNNCNAFGLYSIYSQVIDEQLNDHPNLLHVFAAGNSSNRTCAPFPYGYRTVAGHYQPTKNVLTVANIGKTETSFNGTSSIGPTRDGRIKPEITAMGSQLIAGGNNNNYYASTGTSMAAPNVAGAAVLLQERYVQLHGQMPEAALMKALLMNGAKDIGNIGPDFKFGFGLMNVEHSMKMMELNQYSSDTINTGSTKTFTIPVPPNTTLLKVMLYWADAPGNPSASKSLVNDLDLLVADPNSLTFQPWVLNPNPVGVAADAYRASDRTNNVEQVTINNPIAGNYTISVSGFDVSVPNQKYYVVYETEDDNLQLKFPQGGEKVVAGSAQYIYWESPHTTPNTTIQFSSDNGSNWTTIASLTNGAQRSLAHTFPSNINSYECKVRIVQNGKIVTSNNFTIMQRPTVTLAPIAEQCPGGIKINWNNTPSATLYRIYQKIGDEMVVIANTTNTTYTIQGLSLDSSYWVGVASVINGFEGERSVAINRIPNNGNCTGYNNGDLTIANITPNTIGRRYTQTSLSATTPLNAVVKNMSGVTANNYSISYKINNGTWITNTYNTAINNTDTATINLGNIDLSTPNEYTLTVVVKNNAVTDQINTNDTIVKVIAQLPNDPLPLYDDLVFDFENNNFKSAGTNLIAIDGIEHFDFNATTQYGEINSFVNSSVTLDGTRSLAMYTNRAVGGNVAWASKNNAISTFNLSGHDTSDSEIRLEFEYLLPNYPVYSSDNSVWVRNSDTSAWVKIYDYVVDTVNNLKQHSGSISLRDVFRNQNWNYTSSVQVKWEQYSNTLLSSNYNGAGLVLDNIKLYKVANDVFVVGTESLYNFNCQMSNAVPLKIQVGNGVNNVVYDIAVSYQLDNGPIVTEIIDSIGAKDTITYTFTNPIDLSLPLTYYLNSWVHLDTDTYKLNDTLLRFEIVNQTKITSFPYLQDFEDNDGSYLARGGNISWQYGTPNKSLLNNAASGTKAWLTDTTNLYNDFENSILYAPCFNISSLQQPQLSMSFFYHLENISSNDSNSVFDFVYFEYTNDGGATWKRLGNKGEGLNWYNHANNVFTGNSNAYWQAITIPLPEKSDNYSFRVRFITDESSGYQGVGIDDIHIYDLQTPIYDKDSMTNRLAVNIANNTIIPAFYDNEIMADINVLNESMSEVQVQTYLHQQYSSADQSQYFLPRTFVINSNTEINNEVAVAIYVEDSMMQVIRNDQSCASCTHPNDMYRMGVSIYHGNDKMNHNNTLEDNSNTEAYTFIPFSQITWTPYDKGYRGSFLTKNLGEIWINGGGPTQDLHINNIAVKLVGAALPITKANLNWTSGIDNRISNYVLERKNQNGDFEPIHQANSLGNNALTTYNYIDFPYHTNQSATYRVAYALLADSTIYYSNEEVLTWTNNQDVNVYPNPVLDGKINIEWKKDDDAPLKWALYNSIGQLQCNDAMEGNYTGGRATIDLNNYVKLGSGLYILRVYTNNDTWDFKIIYRP